MDDINYGYFEDKKFPTPKKWLELLKNNETNKARFVPAEYTWHKASYETIKEYFAIKKDGKVEFIYTDDSWNNKTVVWKRLTKPEKDTLKELSGYVYSFGEGKRNLLEPSMNEDRNFLKFLDLIVKIGIVTESDDKKIKKEYERYTDYIADKYKLKLETFDKYVFRPYIAS